MLKSSISKTLFICLFIPAVSAEPPATKALPDFSEQLYISWKNRQSIPHLSQQTGHKNIIEAYKIQRAYVKKRLQADDIAGFKAGLTSSAGQNKFKVKQALTGVLFSSGDLSKNTTIKHAHYQRLMVETEIGFRLNRDVSQTIKSIEQLKSMVRKVYPVIELPDLGFTDMAKLQGIDIVAANVASTGFIIGPGKELSELDNINQLTTVLKYNDEIINQGKATDAFENQWQALLWLINKQISEGYHIKPEQILITGALGKMLPTKVGSYSANFFELGKIDFEIQ